MNIQLVSRCQNRLTHYFLLFTGTHHYHSDNPFTKNKQRSTSQSHPMKQKQAQQILRQGKNVFLTGEPGAGKTHTINTYVQWLRAHRVEPAICASTGIAATHIGGTTIHSWSGIGIADYLSDHDIHVIANRKNVKKRIEKTSVLIIDEVSMLSSNILDNVDAVCKAARKSKLPFGGLQIVCVGDFFQLPPVTRAEEKKFAFQAQAWTEANLTTCYITEQYRQDDSDFLQLLSAIRTSSLEDSHIQKLSERQTASHDAPDNVPHLHTHNRNVDHYNNKRLAALPGKANCYTMSTKGAKKRVETLQRGCLSPEELNLKLDATVMFTKNDPAGKFFNGSLGVVKDFDLKSKLPIVKLHTGEILTVTPAEWTIQEDGSIKARIAQLPLRLAWAITVHKSQGMSLDEAVMDLSNVFEYGQGYVALSRIRRLSGLHLLGYNTMTFNIHPDVLEQDQTFKTSSEKSEQKLMSQKKNDILTLQNTFLFSCGGTMEAISKKEQEKAKAKKQTSAKTPTRFITLEMWKQKNTITEIAKKRELKIGTVMSHIEDLFIEDKISRDEIFKRMVSHELNNSLEKIHQTFTELDTELLTPIKQKLKNKYTFKDLRIARLLRE